MHGIIAALPRGAGGTWDGQPGRGARSGNVAALVALLSLTLGGCAPERDVGQATHGGDAMPAPVARTAGPIAEPEWERNITHTLGATLPPTAFRAGHGSAAAIFGPSRYYWQLALADRGRPSHGGPHTPGKGGFRPPIREKSDVVGLAHTGHVWYLDRETGNVVSEDVGGFGELIARLGVRGTVRTACALGERAIAFLDEARPGQLFVRDLVTAAPVRALAVPQGSVDEAEMPWASLHFGGSTDGPCVLWASRLPHLLVVGDSSVRTLGPFVEPLPAAPARSALATWRDRLLRRRAPSVPLSAGALDATSFPGGVAVLFAGSTTEAGRLVDLYDDSGAYLGTMRLPRRARRIAATNGRLVTLEQQRDSSWIASYPLPARVRSRPLDDEPEVIAPRGPSAAQVLSADSLPH